MSNNSTLQKNLDSLITANNYQISELERKTGVGKNNIYNIVKGVTKKPSAEVLQAIADFFNVTVRDLLAEPKSIDPSLKYEDFDLLSTIFASIIKELKNNQLEIPCSEVTAMLNEAFLYSKDSNSSIADEKFIKWLIRYKYLQNK